MIADIRDIEDFYPDSSPLFEYVNKVAHHFWPGYDVYSDVPEMFSRRFSEGVIDDGRKQKYLATVEVLDTIKAFGLDVSKFWYLCLLLKDLVDSLTIDASTVNPTPREAIAALIEEISKLLPEPCEDPNVEIMKICKIKGTAQLSFKVDAHRHPVRIKDLHTIAVIRRALSDFLSRENNCLLDSSVIESKNSVRLKDIHRIRLFDKYLSWFIKDLKADKTVRSSLPNGKVSLDKKLLVSRMIFILGISDDESYFEEFNENGDKMNFLKNNLKKYKEVKISTSSKAYWVSTGNI